ncbi:MAG: hypothetical protein RLZZ165_7 [Bacteroidota bacterium]|jgi:hypothetical protein
MKQHISLIFTLALLMAVSFGCKVGDEDPVSLASRDGRLAATWNLTAAEVSDVLTYDRGTEITSESYDGTTWTKTKMGPDTTTDSYSYEARLVLEKGGAATVTVTSNESKQTIINTDSTRWSWVDTDKKKSMLMIYSDRFEGPNGVPDVWEVLRLSKKELILYQYIKLTVEVPSVSSTAASLEYTRKFTFEAE